MHVIMKRAIGTILILFTVLGSGEAFLSQRITWWTLRLDELNNKKREIESKKNGNLEHGLISLIEKDSARCRETIEVLKKNTTTDSSPMTIESIRAHIHQSLLPVYSLRMFEIITESAGRDASRHKARNLLSESLKKIFAEDTKQEEDISPEGALTTALTNEEADFLALELVFGSIMEQFDPLYRKIAETIEQDITSRGKKQNDRIEIPNLSALIRQKAAEKCLEIGEPYDTDAALQKSGTWKKISRSLARSASLIDDVHRYLENAGAVSKVEKARYYLHNLASLDKIVFDAEFEKAITDIEGKQKNTNTIHPSESIALPSPNKILTSVDARRRKILSAITGNENQDFFEKALTSLNEAAGHYLHASDKAIEACKKNECATAAEISATTEKLRELRNFSSSYIEKSIAFLEWASKSRSIDTKSLVEDYRYCSERSSAYMNFLRSLAEKSISIAMYDNADLHLKFVVAVKKTPKILATLQHINFPEKNRFQSLTENDINTLKKHRSQLSETAQQTQRNLNTALATYQSRMEELAKKRQGKASKLEAGLAQYDMDQLVITLREYASYYSTLVYADTALKRYAEEYRAIESPKESTEINIRARAIRQGRLIPLIEDFDPERIRRELATKNYLRKEIRSLMAKTRSLAIFYRQNGFSVGSLFTVEDSGRISELLDRQSRHEVADWIMTETNFDDIDRKAVKKLSLSSIKKDWKLDADGKFIGTEKTDVVIEPQGIRFSMPGVWIEEAVDEYLSERKVSKAYRSRDGSVSIYVAIGTIAEGASLSDHSAAWHNKLGSKIIKSAGGRISEFEYQWVLARAAKNRVRESLILKSAPSEAVIISGQSPKDRYNFFHKKMEMIKESIRKAETPAAGQ